MRKGRILTHIQMKREIRESHIRSQQYGINQEKRSPDQKKLSPEALNERKDANKDLLNVVLNYIDEFLKNS